MEINLSTQLIEKPDFMVAKDILKPNVAVISGIRELDDLISGFKSGEITFIDGDSILISNIPNQICVNTYRMFHGNVVYIDGGVCADPYRISQYARKMEMDQREVLEHVFISRAFTVYQLTTLIQERLEDIIVRYKPRVLIVGRFPLLYFDSDVPSKEAQVLLRNNLHKIKEFTTSEAFTIVDKLADAGISILTFSGGEPLLRNDIYDVIKRATDKGLYCTIASNGLLMIPEAVEKLYNSGIRRVEIGLDGVKAETHDFLRNKKGCFKITVEGIKNCVHHRYFDEIAITTTLYQSNIQEIPKIIDFAESLGGTRFYLNRLIPAGRGKKITHLDVSPEEKKNILKHLHQRLNENVTNGRGIQCYARGMTYLSRVGYEESQGRLFTVSEAFSGYENMFQKKFGVELPKIVRYFSKSFSGCSAGLTYCGLSEKGDLLPCVPVPIKLGNLLNDNLEDIWANDKNLLRMRDRKYLQGSCRNCNYNGLCGGCRYTAFYLTNDWLGPDLSCPYEPLPQKNFNN